MRKIFLFALTLSAGLLYGQHFSLNTQEKEAFAQEAQKILTVLASDSMEGREAGTAAELKASRFIISYLKENHLNPYFKTYEDTFLIYKYPSIRKATLKIGKASFTYPKDFIFYFASQSKKDTFWFVNDSTDFIHSSIIYLCPQKLYTPQDSTVYYSHIDDNLKKIQYSQGTTFIFVNKPSCEETLPASFVSSHLGNKNILLATSPRLKNFLIELKTPVPYELNIELNSDTIAVSRNIIAWIDNKAPTTIVLGAHYDHLGYGLQTSRYVGPRKVHNGADDNGSGTTLLMLLAKYMNNHREMFKNHNYIFAFFSGEEKGLLGSKHFCEKHLTFKTLSMLNFDMVGRFDSLGRPLHILGIGTSPLWDSLIYISTTDKHIKKIPNSIRGSDQYSFYAKQIPVLFFFTGMHADYHTPTDDVNKINFQGIAQVLEYAINILARLNKVDNLPFTTIKEDTTTRHGYGKFTLGVVPDFTWNGKGVRIDEIIPGKTAYHIGLQKNDIIVQLNESKIENIYQYMEALQHVSSEHENVVYILRDGQQLTFTFKVN